MSTSSVFFGCAPAHRKVCRNSPAIRTAFMPQAPEKYRSGNLSVGGGCVKQIQETEFLLCGKERGFEGIPRQLSQVFFGKAEGLLGQLVFPRQGSTKHGGIVSVERDHDSLVKILANRMSAQRRTGAGTQIAGETNLHRHLAGG